MKPRPLLAISICLVLYLLFIWSTTQKNAREERARRAHEAAVKAAQPAANQPPLAPAPNAAPRPGAPAAAGQPAAAAGQKQFPPRPALPRQDSDIAGNPEIHAVASSRYGSLGTVILSKFHNYSDPSRPLVLLPEQEHGPQALALRLERPSPNDPPFPPVDAENWEMAVEPGQNGVTFRNAVPDAEGNKSLAISKKILLEPDSSHLQVVVTVENQGSARQSFQYTLWGPSGIQSESIRSPGQDLVVVNATFANNGPPVVALNPVPTIAKVGAWENPSRPVWVGCMNNYFAAILAPVTDAGVPSPDVAEKAFAETFVEPASLEEQLAKNHPGRKLAELTAEERKALDEKAIKTARTGLRSKLIDLEPGASRTDRYILYLGTRESNRLGSYDKFNFTQINNHGITTWLVNLFLWILPGLHVVTRSWGLSIVCLTVLVRMALHPINRRQQVGMMKYQKKMQKIQPQLNELKERYGDNRLKLNQEMQKLFKENNVNPAQMMGGCLMIFLQFPVWIGLIETLGFALFLRQASFLWIKDLSQPDRLFTFQHNFWYLPHDLNILPVLYVILMIVQQKMQPKPTDPQALQAQKMMSFMMILFGFIFYGFPSGLLVYFLASAIFGLIETRIIKRIIKRQEDEAALDTAAAIESGTAPGSSLYQASKGVLKAKKAPREKGMWR